MVKIGTLPSVSVDLNWSLGGMGRSVSGVTFRDRLGLSARAYDRIIKVSRTIADIASDDQIATSHLAGAIPVPVVD